MTSAAASPVDLHVHSLVSDGRDSPSDVIARASRRGVEVLAFADHSVVTWSEGLRSIAAAAGVCLAPAAMEVSCFQGSRKHHILIYGSASLNPELVALSTRPLIWKNQQYQRVIESLRARGAALLDLSEMLGASPAESDPLSIPRRMGSRTLVATNLAASAGIDFDAAYRCVRAEMEQGKPEGNRSQRLAATHLPALEVLKLADRTGAFSALAHPLWEAHRDDFELGLLLDDIELFAGHGLDGLETRSYHHPEADERAELRAALDRHDLLRVGGSDYHGNGRTDLGCNGLSREEWAHLVAAIGELVPTI